MNANDHTTWFWCSVHKKAEPEGFDTGECLLTGPYPSRQQAEAFAAEVRSADSGRDGHG